MISALLIVSGISVFLVGLVVLPAHAQNTTAECEAEFRDKIYSGDLPKDANRTDYLNYCISASSQSAVGGSSGSPDATSAQNAIDRSNEYDPSVDKGFELSETELITKLNHDRFIRQLRVKVKIAGREIADDGKREVLEYDFGGCPRGIGSVDRYSKNVLSFTVTATHDCVRRGDPALFVVYAAVLHLGAAKNEKEAVHLVSHTFEAGKNAPLSEAGVRSNSTTAHGRTLQIVELPKNTGLIFKVYPTASDAEQPTQAVRADIRMSAGRQRSGAATTSDSKLSTCAQFRDRLTKAEGVLGGAVPRFEFRDLDKPGEVSGDDHSYAIENVKEIDGELACSRKTDALSSLQIGVAIDDQNSKENVYAVGRFLVSMHALTWAYTQWPKGKVQSVVSRLMKEAVREADKSEFRGDTITQGTATYDVRDEVTLKYWVGGGLTFMIDASTAEEKR